MTLTIDVQQASARLDDLLAEVEAGRDVVIWRGSEKVAKLTKAEARSAPVSVASEIRKGREAFGPITIEEILEWRDEGRR